MRIYQSDWLCLPKGVQRNILSMIQVEELELEKWAIRDITVGTSPLSWGDVSQNT